MSPGTTASRKRALWVMGVSCHDRHAPPKHVKVQKRSMIMKPIISALLALAFVTAIAATAGAENWDVKTFWQQVDSNHN
jgi:hypothetical protein